mmetsp:Transcript_148637/g.270517  ORF Transcript_148637/g.270517 Transcript_148637/m.270517 type:complete len:771 (+) Transcript_148637:62-2374(+)
MFDFDEMDEMNEQASDEEDDDDTPQAGGDSPKQLPTESADQLFKVSQESPKEIPRDVLQATAPPDKIVTPPAVEIKEESVLQARAAPDKSIAQPASEIKEESPSNAANVDSDNLQMLVFDTLTEAVLYIVQMEFPATPQEVWNQEGLSTTNLAGFSKTGDKRVSNIGGLDLGGGRFLAHLPNGICMATAIDMKRSVEPVRMESMIYQTKAANFKAAQKIQTWEAATRMPLLQFCAVWELTPINNGTSTVIRRTIKEFEQFQNQNIPLGESVMASIDQDNRQRFRKYYGPQAQLPANYVLFSATATADLLEAVSVGASEATLQGLLAKRADANHICDPVDRESEMTPLTAAVEAGSVAATKLLLEKGSADPNVVCCQNEKTSDGGVFFTAMDVVRKVPNGRARDIEQLLRNSGGVPMSKLDGVGSPNASSRRKQANLEGVDPAAFERAIRELDAELRLIRRKPAAEQRALFRKLLLQWHPDKNQGQEALATSVFQWLQQAAMSGGRRNAGGVHWRMGREAPREKQSKMTRREERRQRERRPPRPQPMDAKGNPVPMKEGLMTTEMRICSRNWLLEFMIVLLDRGQSVNQIDKDGRTALFYAVRGVRNPNGTMQTFPAVCEAPTAYNGASGTTWGWFETDMITFIVEDCEADVNWRDKMKMTPLMEATRFGCAHTAELLLDAKADIHARDVKGNTALDIARMPAPEYCFTQEDEWLTRTHEGMTKSSVEEGMSNMRKCITNDRSLVARLLEEELLGNALEGGSMRRVGQLRA